MISAHIISDTNFKFHEFTPEIELDIPDVDLVILNGNIGKFIKRGFFYAEELCKKYPEKQFIYNLGWNELYYPAHVPKNDKELVAAISVRSNFYEGWPKNLHSYYQDSKVIQLQNGETIDVFCAFGYPNIKSYEGAWESHIWWKNIITTVSIDINDDRVTLPPKTTHSVSHSFFPIWASEDWVKNQNQNESEKIQEWIKKSTNNKILITITNPINDSRCYKQDYDMYDINFDGLWIASDNAQYGVEYCGARLYSNPGVGKLARSQVINF